MTFTWNGGPNDPEPRTVTETPSGHVAWDRRRADGRNAAGYGDPRNGQTYEVVSLFGRRSASRTAANHRATAGVTLMGRREARQRAPKRDGSWIVWGAESAGAAAVDLLTAAGTVAAGIARTFIRWY